MIRNHLDISTAHMPSEVPDFGDLQAVEHDCGFILFVAPDSGVEPAWLRPVLTLARLSQCALIVFDRDADVHPALPSFNW